MQVEECLLDYATSLMGNKTTWTVAAEILAFCPCQGKPALEALLANLPVSVSCAYLCSHLFGLETPDVVRRCSSHVAWKDEFESRVASR